MSSLDYLLLGLGAAVAATFVPWSDLLDSVAGLTPDSSDDDRLDCLSSIVDAMDECDDHGHSELADKLEELLPEAAKCIRGKQ